MALDPPVSENDITGALRIIITKYMVRLECRKLIDWRRNKSQ
jgi:hypothetical protein